MIMLCFECGRRYNDEFHSTVCPHRGIGFCVVCDCTVCVCDPQTTNERSNKFAERQAETDQSKGNPDVQPKL